MTDTLRIKRRATGGAAGPPASLANAEVAFNEQDYTLYYGYGGTPAAAASIVPIGGSGAFLPLTGGTLTGPLILNADPTVNLGAATKQYVDAHTSGGIGDAPNNSMAYGRKQLSWWMVPELVQVGTGTLDPGNIDTGNLGRMGLWQITNQTGATGWPAGMSGDNCGLILHGYNSNSGWQSQLLMSGRERGAGAAIWYRSQDSGWNPWRRLLSDAGGFTVAAATTWNGLLTFTSGIDFNSQIVTGTDLSKHIRFYGGYGFNLTNARLNIISGANIVNVISGTDIATISSSGLAVTGSITASTSITAGTAAPAGLQTSYVFASGGFEGWNHASNAHYDGTNWRYISSGNAAGTIGASPTTLSFSAAAQGTAGNVITWGAPMTYNSAGQLIAPTVVGSSSVQAGTSQGYVSIVPSGTAANTGIIQFYQGGTRKGYIGYSDAASMYINGDGLSIILQNNTGVQGTFGASSTITGSNGRIISQNNGNNPSFACYDGTWGRTAGILLATDNKFYIANMDSSGNYSSARAYWDGSNNFANNGYVLSVGAGVYAQNDLTFGFYNGGSGRVFSFMSGWYWDINTANGDLYWRNPSFGTWQMLLASNGVTYFQHILQLQGSSYGVAYITGAYSNGYTFCFGWSNIVGNLVSVGVQNGGAAYAIANGNSDARLKTNIQPSTFDCLGAVNRLPLVEFDWIEMDDPWKLKEARAALKISKLNARPHVGMIAQDVAAILPGVVYAGDDFDDHLGRIWSIDPTAMNALLVGAVQQLAARVAALETRA